MKRLLIIALSVIWLVSVIGCGSSVRHELNYLTIAAYDDPSVFHVSPNDDLSETSFAANGDRYAIPAYHKKGVILHRDGSTKRIERTYQYYDVCFVQDRLFMLPIASFTVRKTKGLCCYDLNENLGTTLFEDRRCCCIEPYGDSLLIAFGPNDHITEELLQDCGLYLYHPETQQLELLIPDIFCQNLYVKDGSIYINYYYSNEYVSSGYYENEHLICYDAEHKSVVWDIIVSDSLRGQFTWCLIDDQNVLLYGFVYEKNESRRYQLIQCNADGGREVILDQTSMYSQSIAADARYVYFDRHVKGADGQDCFEVVRYDLATHQLEVLFPALGTHGHFEKWDDRLVYIFAKQ